MIVASKEGIKSSTFDQINHITFKVADKLCERDKFFKNFLHNKPYIKKACSNHIWRTNARKKDITVSL